MKLVKTATIVLPILLALTGGTLLLYELNARKTPPLIMETSPLSAEREPDAIAFPTTPQVELEEIEREPEIEKEASRSTEAMNPNTIHIRGKFYPLIPNIEEDTLKKHIGWMDTSAKPGDVGVSVVMGHRNQQLRCLKDVKKGDVITIVDAHGVAHPYKVESGRIVEDNNITFNATDRRELVLITCYPFYFSGSAPHQYVVTAVE